MLYWFNLSRSFTMLALELQEVIVLRFLKLTVGGSAATSEARLMVSEKASAAVETALSFAAGASAALVIGAYREKVRANRIRLAT